MTWAFCAEPFVVTWIAGETVHSRISGGDLLRFAVFLACGLAHAYATRESEERRRGAHGNANHVDQTSIWFFPAALVLPIPLTVLLIAIIRIQRWLIARKPFYKWLHTCLAIAMSALCVHTVSIATPLHDWLTGQRSLPTSGGDILAASLCLTGAVAAYFLAQAVMVGAVRALAHTFPADPVTIGESEPRVWVDALGTLRDNAEILATLLLAAAAALFAAFSLPLLAIMVPIAIYSTRLHQRVSELATDNEQLQVDATHDVLTRLPNRRGFEDAARAALARDHRTGHPTALLLLDLDRFKSINDTMGHLVGDQVLTAFAGAVRAATRESDLLCRWGGEEVAVLLPETDLPHALVLAERVRTSVATMKIPVTKAAGGETIILGSADRPGCTVSIGVAVTGNDDADLNHLADKADQALYQAKRLGRDQVRVAAPASGSADSARPVRERDAPAGPV